MTDVHQLPDIGKVKDEASQWIVLLHADDVSAESRVRFVAWRDAHPLHARTYEEMLSTWREFTAAGPLVRAVSFAQSMSVASTARPSTATHKRRLWLSAAAVCVAAMVVSAFYVSRFWQGRTFDTAVGEQATVSLLDGSSMTLNSGSLARVDFSSSSRVIHLERGEAFFKVAHDSDRPFWVVSGSSWVRAVGTAFNVYLRPANMQVTVSEGVVKVGVAQPSLSNTPSDSAFAKTMVSLLNAGEQADIGGANTTTRRLSSTQLSQQLTWRSGTLYFEKQALSDVVDELNRYTRLQLIVEGDKLRQLTVGGAFQANPEGAEALLSLLEQRSFGLSVRREGERAYIEERRD